MKTANGQPLLLAIVGQTSTGKSRLALSLAETYVGEIINCDSTAVYRGFDIGTDKVPRVERRGVPHHLIDVVEPTEIYSAARYGREAAEVVRGVTARQRLPIVVGGTGLYYRALTRGLFSGPGRNSPESLDVVVSRNYIGYWLVMTQIQPTEFSQRMRSGS